MARNRRRRRVKFGFKNFGTQRSANVFPPREARPGVWAKSPPPPDLRKFQQIRPKIDQATATGPSATARSVTE